MPILPELKKKIEADQTLDPNYRTTLLATLENAPENWQKAQIELYNGGLRQSEFDKKMNEGKAALAKQEEELNARAGNWKSWYDQNKPKFDDMQTKYDALVKERDELQAKVAAGGFGSGTEAENAAYKQLNELKDGIGGLKQGMDELKKGFVTTEDANKAVLNMTNQIFNISAIVNTMAAKHQFKYNEPFDQVDFNKFLNGKNYDLSTAEGFDQAYADYTKPREDESRIKAEVDKRTKDALSKQNLPIDGGSGGEAVGMGPLQMKLNRENKVADPLAREAPIGAAAAAAAAKLREQGKW